MIIREKAYPRAALIGNPSDGYFGKTIAFVFRNYSAEVTLYESPSLEILPSVLDYNTYENMADLASSITKFGYYGGIRLLKACVKTFYTYCVKEHIPLGNDNFTLRYQSDIPNRLGMAGSSAIITATMRAMIRFFQIEIPKPVLANLVLSVELDELGIKAGLQDRVAQVYETPVYMDFNKDHMEKFGYGIYEPIEIPDDLPLFIAYRTDLAEGSEILHSRLALDYEAGVPEVHAAVREWASLTDKVRDALASRQCDLLSALLDRNFDLRCEVCGSSVSEKNRRMVQIARQFGASAKFTGSGGAIIGLYKQETFNEMRSAMQKQFIQVLLPDIIKK
jgi:glucuronokinase